MPKVINAVLITAHILNAVQLSQITIGIRPASRKSKTVLQNWNMTQPSQGPLL